MKVVAIIPTYNEKDNIGLLIEEIEKKTSEMPHQLSILIVDDSSPDGTAEVVRAQMEKHKNVYLISGKKEGLGVAYQRGMKYAVDVLKAEAVMEMDADFSHKPEDVLRLLEALVEGVDFVIGSRYVSGGKIPGNWGLKRRMNSKWGNIFARYVAGLSRVRDCTAGFRAIRTSLLKRIDLDTLGVQGYAFQIALLNEALRNGAVVNEVPVEFVDRTRGETKLGFSDIIEFFKSVWWMRISNSNALLKFILVGGSGVLVNLIGFTTLMDIGVNTFVASPIAIEASIISNFFLNNYWTFSNRKSDDRVRIKGLKFNAISLIALAMSYTTFIVLSIMFPGTRPQIHQLAGIIPATFVNYYLNSHWTFKDKTDEPGKIIGLANELR